jgi:hypothetical protein
MTATQATTTSVQFQDTDKPLSETLTDIAASLPEGSITVRQLLALVGEQAILLFCIIMTIPFLTPIPLPGISTVFGLLIMLVSVGVIFNRLPWLPSALLNRPVASGQLAAVLNRGADLFRKIERFLRPRMLALTHDSTTNRLNGVMLFVGGFLLILPLPVLPLSNFLPGWAVLFLSAGMLSRDGVFVLLGYLFNIITIIYFAAVAIAILAAGQSISSLFQEPAMLLPILR